MTSVDHENPQRASDPLVNMVGERIALGPLREDLISLYHQWDNDFATLRTLEIPRPENLNETRAWYDAVKARSDREVFFTVYERLSFRPIGHATLFNIDYRNRTAEFGLLIGEPAARGQGFGTETTRLMLDYAFTALGVHSVLLGVWEFNHAGQRAYAKAGFHECGRRRQSKFMGGKMWDTIYMDCLATEFVSPVLAHVLLPDEQR